jgi:hypothetical protein
MVQIKKRLDKTIRKYMLEELEHDIEHACLDAGEDLNHSGRAELPELLREAVREGSEETLAKALRQKQCMPVVQTVIKNGKVSLERVTEADYAYFSKRIFNTLYVRGKCRQAQGNGCSNLVFKDKGARREYQSTVLLNTLRNDGKLSQIIDFEDVQKREFKVVMKE